MRVLVTGGSGFVGCHAIAALVERGHEIVALARNREKLERALAAVGKPQVRVVPGDVVDADAVDSALRDVDAVLHAAGVYSLDPRRRVEMWRTNVDAARLVLQKAVDAGCDPVVHVSSVVALFPLPQDELAPLEPPIGNARTPYMRSKVAAERFARELQAAGAPVVTTYPGNVWGPHDPGPGEMVAFLRGFLGNRFPFLLHRAGLTVADVRWLARAHAALFEPGKGARIVTMGGPFLPMRDVFGVLRDLTGRRLPRFIPSIRLTTYLVGWLADLLRAATGVELPYSLELSRAPYLAGRTNDARAIALAGPYPDPVDTIRDSILWAHGAGHLRAGLAGLLTAGKGELQLPPP